MVHAAIAPQRPARDFYVALIIKCLHSKQYRYNALIFCDEDEEVVQVGMASVLKVEPEETAPAHVMVKIGQALRNSSLSLMDPKVAQQKGTRATKAFEKAAQERAAQDRAKAKAAADAKGASALPKTAAAKSAGLAAKTAGSAVKPAAPGAGKLAAPGAGKSAAPGTGKSAATGAAKSTAPGAAKSAVPGAKSAARAANHVVVATMSAVDPDEEAESVEEEEEEPPKQPPKRQRFETKSGATTSMEEKRLKETENDEVNELRRMIAAQNAQIQALMAAQNHSSKPVPMQGDETGFTQSYSSVPSNGVPSNGGPSNSRETSWWRPGRRGGHSNSEVACGQKREREAEERNRDSYEYAKLLAESAEDERQRRVRLETMRALHCYRPY